MAQDGKRLIRCYKEQTEFIGEDGDYDSSSELEDEREIALDPDDIADAAEDGLTESQAYARAAAEFILSEGYVECSSSQYSPGDWWSTVGEIENRDYFERGISTRYSCHLHGWTDKESTAIATAVKGSK